MLRLHEVLDMVGDHFDAGWISASTGVQLLVEYAQVTEPYAAYLLVQTARPDAAPLPEWNGWDHL